VAHANTPSEGTLSRHRGQKTRWCARLRRGERPGGIPRDGKRANVPVLERGDAKPPL